MQRPSIQFAQFYAMAVVMVIVFLLVTFLQVNSKQNVQPVEAAGEQVVAFEAESGQRTGPIELVINDTSASNNIYARFNSLITPTIGATLIPTSSPTPTVGTGGTRYPAQVLNLTNWKITIPFDGSDSGTTADEIKQPALATYKDPNYFFVSPSGDSVVFKAHAGGATTSGSGYPRSELREMTSNGATEAAWSSSTGTHTMTIDQKITHLPVAKPHIVVGQIHDSSDDVTTFRLEGTKLFIEINGVDGPILTSNYQLGTRFTVGFEVRNNQVKYFYNGNPITYVLNKSFSGAYFKAGAYTQSSCRTISGESCDAYGEVEIYNVQVTHN